MPLTLRPTGLSSPAYADKLDYVVCEDVIGRLYEDVTRSPIFVGSGPSRCTSTPSSGRAGKAPTEWVSVFQREGGMRIYLAGPLFTTAEREFNAALAAGLRALGHEVWVPQESEQQQTTAKAIAAPVGRSVLCGGASLPCSTARISAASRCRSALTT